MKKILFLWILCICSVVSVQAKDVVTTYEGDGSSYIVNYGTLGVYQFNTPALVRRGNKVLKDGQLLSPRAYQNFLENTCPEAFQQYRKGKRLTDAGWGCMIAGPILMVGLGVPLFICGHDGYYSEEYNDYIYDENYQMIAAGISMLAIGGATFAVSIPLVSVGYSKRHKSVDTYNRQCAPALTYSLTAHKNGLGLAINF